MAVSCPHGLSGPIARRWRGTSSALRGLWRIPGARRGPACQGWHGECRRPVGLPSNLRQPFSQAAFDAFPLLNSSRLSQFDPLSLLRIVSRARSTSSIGCVLDLPEFDSPGQAALGCGREGSSHVKNSTDDVDDLRQRRPSGGRRRRHLAWGNGCWSPRRRGVVLLTAPHQPAPRS